MKTSEELKKIVQEKYGDIAGQENTCCGVILGGEEVYNIMTDDYTGLEGYDIDANLGLGCGLPTMFARIGKGDTVVDLGSGAGNDCFIARHETGETGKVIGIDFTNAMIQKARVNAQKLGLKNVEFRHGDIEDMPVLDNEADVIVSNCVLNLVPNKEKVFNEIYRTLRPGGHFSISDIVLVGDLPKKFKEDAEMYAGCVAGAIQRQVYLDYIKEAGFQNISIQKEKAIVLPDEILDRYLTPVEKELFKKGTSGIFSITVFAEKPGIKIIETLNKPIKLQGSCCDPASSCC